MPELLARSAAAVLITILSTACTRDDRAARKLTAASDHMARGNYAAAAIEYKNALALKPDHPEALKGLGLVLMRQGAPFEACRILTPAKQKLPADDEVGTALAQALLELGFLDQSRKESLEVLGRSPAHGEAILLLAEASLTAEATMECEDRITRANAPDKAPFLLASALLELRRGQNDAGSQLIERAIKADPEFARAYALQGSLLMRNQQPEQAVAALKKAADLAGPRSSATIAYARLLAGLDRKDEASALLKAATASAPDYLPNWRLLAQLSIAAGNDAEATEHLSKVLAKSPLDMDACVLQAEIWVRNKEAEKATALLEDLTKTFPSRPLLELALGKTYLAAGDLRKAANSLDSALALAPDNTQAVLLRAGLYLQTNQTTDAIRLLEPLLAAQPNNRVTQDLLIQAYQAAKRPAEATELLTRQAAAAPDDPAFQLRLGQVLVSQNKLVEARAAFEQAVKLAPDDLAYVSQLVALDQQEGKHDAAMARAEAYLTAHPKSPQAHLLKAALCFMAKDLQGAETFASKTIELNPQDQTAYGMLVRILIDSGRSEQAVARMRELLKTSPNSLPVLMQLGLLLQNLGRMDEARASFLEMVKIAPDFAPAYNNLACLDSEPTGDLDKALENARKARSLAPQAPAIADTLGWVHHRRGDFNEAMPLLQEAANAMPLSAQVQYHLAMAHYMMHHVPEATSLLQKSLSIESGLTTKERSEAERRLANLRDAANRDLATLEQQLAQDPSDVVLIITTARKLADAGRHAESLSAYQKALAINDLIEAAHLGAAELYSSALNQPEKALEAANLARKIAPQSPRVAAVLGSLNFRAGKHEEAYHLLQEASRQLPTDTTVQIDYAWAAYGMGRVADARSAMGKLQLEDSGQAKAVRGFLALTDAGAATNPATAELLANAPASGPEQVPALMIRAAMQEQAGEDPAPTYSEVLRILPRFDPARIALARVYLDDPARLADAESLANTARNQLKDDPELTGVLAIINFRKGEFDYSAQLLKELSAKRPLTGRELFALGMSQAATGRQDEARESLTRALAAKLTKADTAAATSTLEELARKAPAN